jgi:signal transduction histidine kinase
MTANPADEARTWRWRAALVSFVVLALVGSVIIPTAATGRIITLFEEINEWIEPARLASIRLNAGVATEHAQRNARKISGGSDDTTRFESMQRENDRDLTVLKQRSERLDAESRAAVAGIARAFHSWRAAGTNATADSVSIAINRLQLALAIENGRRLTEVQRSQRVNFYSNVELVIAALAAIAAITVLTVRERRMADLIRVRAARESSLREAAESFAESFSEEKISAVAERTAVFVLAAQEAHVVLVRDHPHIVDEPALSEAIESNAPAILAVDEALAVVEATPATCAIVIPLRNSEELVGVLFVHAKKDVAFHEDDLLWARTFQHIAALAYEKSRLLRVEVDARVKLERLVDSRSRLMRGFSHDVKNPLGAADGFAALLASGVYGDLSSAQQQGIDRIRNSIRNSLTLIDDLHDFVRAEAGHVSLRPTPTDVGVLVQSMGLQYEAAATAKGLSLKVTVAADLPSANIDAARLRQIIANLLGNALKYTDAGFVELRATMSSDGARGNGVTVEVADTGCGIPMEKQNYIFEEFSRLHSTSHPGAGLGLSISKLLAEALGGRISVRSTQGAGSIFTLWVPTVPPELVCIGNNSAVSQTERIGASDDAQGTAP